MADEAFDPVAAGAVAVAEPQEPFDPTAHGAIPVQQPEKPSIPALAGRTAWDVIKQVTGLHQPTSLSEVAQEIFPTHFENTLVGGMLGGAKHTLEQGIAAAKTPDFSPEKFAFAGNVVGQAGGQLLGLLGLKAEPAIAKTAPTLAETAGIAKPDIAQPVEPVATDAVTQETHAAPVAPEVVQPVPAATEATANVLGKQEPVAPTTASGTGEVVPKTSTIRGQDMSTGDDVRWMSGGTWDGKIQDIVRKPNGKHDVTVKATNGETFTLKNAEDYGINSGRSKFITDANKPSYEGWERDYPDLAPSVQEAPVSTTGSGIQETGGAAPLSTETTQPYFSSRENELGSHLMSGKITRSQYDSEISKLQGEPNAIQEQSAGSILQHPQESVGTTGGERVGVEPSVQGETPAGARSEGVTGTAPQEVTSQIPEGAKATVNFKTSSGKLVPKEMDAREAEGIFTKEKSSYQALLNCLGA